jgi:hypothetical protein
MCFDALLQLLRKRACLRRSQLVKRWIFFVTFLRGFQFLEK